jgi:membrane protease YdiL (CAAX protease family)
MQFALFLVSLVWYLCAQAIAGSAARGLAQRFDLPDLAGIVPAIFQLFLIVFGFAMLRAIEQRRAPLRLTLGLPRRATSGVEWATGAAIGWGVSVLAILPMVLARAVRVFFWTQPHMYVLLGLSLAMLAVATLAHALAIYGYGFQRLIAAIGPVRATVLIAVLSGIHTGLNPALPRGSATTAVLVAVLGAILISVAWLRTHGLWLAWGLHFAWAASTGVLFGLPLGSMNVASVVESRTHGPVWLTGGDFGQAAAVLSILVLLAGIIVVVKTTSDWAWAYTHPPLIPAGYDVTIAPPAAHVAMEAAAASTPVNLVQILPAAPQGTSTGPATDH